MKKDKIVWNYTMKVKKFDQVKNRDYFYKALAQVLFSISASEMGVDDGERILYEVFEHIAKMVKSFEELEENYWREVYKND